MFLTLHSIRTGIKYFMKYRSPRPFVASCFIFVVIVFCNAIVQVFGMANIGFVRRIAF